jgi:adenylate kinase
VCLRCGLRHGGRRASHVFGAPAARRRARHDVGPAVFFAHPPHPSSQAAATVSRGDLLPDDLVLDLVRARLAASAAAGVPAVVDGFPRTAAQAATLLAAADVRLALNLTLPEAALIDKCLGRRACGKCGKGFNVADIFVPARGGAPAIAMPPMPPPPECEPYMEVRADDNPTVVRRRLDVYAREAAPVEAAFRSAGVLLDFPVAGGVRETFPRLLDAVTGATGGEARGERAA